jgi:hypothetical protein
MTLDGLLCMALQDAIHRAQRGNRLAPLLGALPLNSCGTAPLAALHERLVHGDPVLSNRLRGLARLAPRLRAPPRCPSRIVGLVARFPFIEPPFGAVPVAADRRDLVAGKRACDRLLSAVFLMVVPSHLLLRLTWHPVRDDLFSLSWHDLPRAMSPHEEDCGKRLEQPGVVPLTRLPSVGDSA